MILPKLTPPRRPALPAFLASMILLLSACSRSADLPDPAAPPVQVAGFVEVKSELDAGGGPAYNSTLVCYTRSGAVRWQKTNLYGVLPFAHRAAHGLLFTLLSTDRYTHRLEALDLATGNPAWSTPASRFTPYDCLASDSLLYVTATNEAQDSSWLRAYAWRTGSFVWEQYFPGVLYNLTLDSAAGRMFFSQVGGGIGYRVQAFNVRTRSTEWSKHFGGLIDSNGPFLLHGDRLLFIDGQSHVHSVSTATGDEAWSRLNGKVNNLYTIGDHLFVSSHQNPDNSILSLHARTGTVNWSKGPEGFMSAAPFYIDVLMPPNGRSIYGLAMGFERDTLDAFEPATGALLHRTPVPRGGVRMLDDASFYVVRDAYIDPSAGNRSKLISYDLATRQPKDSFFVLGLNGVSIAPYW